MKKSNFFTTIANWKKQIKAHIYGLITIMLILFVHFANAQTIGSWVIPPNRVDFNVTTPTTTTIQNSPYIDTYMSSEAAFDNNGNILFYTVDDKIYVPGEQGAIGTLLPIMYEAQMGKQLAIINLSSSPLHFYIIYYSTNFTSGGAIGYAKIDCSGGNISIVENGVEIGFFGSTYCGIAVTQEKNNERGLYTCGYPNLNRYTINASGITFQETILNGSNSTLNSYDFETINLELSLNDRKLTWGTIPIPFVSLLEIIVVDLEDNGSLSGYNHFLIDEYNYGLIKGVEFSTVPPYDNVFFSSSDYDLTYGGISVLNTQNNTITSLTNNASYGMTFLQTASDGYIYGVSNNGQNLSRIESLSNIIEPNICQLSVMSNGHLNPLYVTYYLPENFSYISFVVDVDYENESCSAEADGWIELTVSGGITPYTFDWNVPTPPTPTLLEDLSPGTYTCTVTDAMERSIFITQDIETDPSLFNYTGPYQINNLVEWQAETFQINGTIEIMNGGTLLVSDASKAEFNANSGIIIHNGGTLEVSGNSEFSGLEACNNKLWSGITVEDLGYFEINSMSIKDCESVIENGGTVHLPTNAELTISGDTKITVDNSGYICVGENVIINLIDYDSEVELVDGYLEGVNPGLNITPSPSCDICNATLTGNGSFNVNSNYMFQDDIVIQTNTQWVDDFDRSFKKDIIIKDNAILEVGNIDLYFSKSSRIIIEAGGKLILDNTVLDALNFCLFDNWQGIEIWGDSYQHQYTIDGDCAQGILEMENDATIKNAYQAVNVWNPEDWYSMGGIIQANDAHFINNRVSVGYMSYQNFHPFYEVPVSNLGYFTNCEFIINNEYKIASNFYSHITMWDVKGIQIKGCYFGNEQDETESNGYGIYTESAGYRIVEGCGPSNIRPCPDPIPTTFSGFHVGVGALNAENTHTIYISDALFEDNQFGIQLSGVYDATIVNSDFFVGSNSVNDKSCKDLWGCGIELTDCYGYAIEDNYFTRGNGAFCAIYVGIRTIYHEDAEPAYNEIYKNEFVNLELGNRAEVDNYDDFNDYNGLTYLCNKNSDTKYSDFQVYGEGIARIQGYFTEPASNEFSKEITPIGSDFNNNNAIHPVDYIYYAGDIVQKPENTLKVFIAGTNSTNSCPSHFGGIGGGIDPLRTYGTGLTAEEELFYEQEFVDNLSSYNAVKTLYGNLKDGGSTEDLQTEIETSWPLDMWELRAELLGKSPHLSKEVLMTTADKTDVLPDAVIFEILSANPDEMKNEELLKYLEDKDNPLPQYMIDILRALTGNVTYKTILQNQIAYHNKKKTNAAYTIIRNSLNDSIYDMDGVRNWLDNLGSLAMDYQIVDSYLQEGNTNDALTFLNTLPQTYNLSGEKLEEFNRYKSFKLLLIDLKNQGRNIFMLTDTEKTMIEALVTDSKGIAGTQARNILQFVYGEEYCDCPDFSDSTGLKSSSLSSNIIATNAMVPKVNVSPNPASDWVAFDYELSILNTNAIIQISDNKGNIVHNILLKDKKGQKIWDTRKVASGVYYYKLQANDLITTGKIIISN
jgi:hypothetical protein